MLVKTTYSLNLSMFVWGEIGGDALKASKAITEVTSVVPQTNPDNVSPWGLGGYCLKRIVRWFRVFADDAVTI